MLLGPSYNWTVTPSVPPCAEVIEDRCELHAAQLSFLRGIPGVSENFYYQRFMAQMNLNALTR